MAFGFVFFSFLFLVELMFLNVLLSLVVFLVLMTFLRFYNDDSMHGVHIILREVLYIGISNSDAQ